MEIAESEAVEKLRPALESLNPMERNEVFDLLSDLEKEQFVAELKRRREEYESGFV